jgi:hypothetical protein
LPADASDEDAEVRSTGWSGVRVSYADVCHCRVLSTALR